MEENGLIYLTQQLSNLLGIPTRLFKNNERIKLFSHVTLVIDPITLNKKEISKSIRNVDYFLDKYNFYYAILNSKEYKIIIGPFTYFTPKINQIYPLIADLKIKKEDTKIFINSIQNISSMPLETVISSLCSFNFLLNNEKLNIEDIIIKKDIKNTNSDNNFEEILIPKGVTNIRNSTLDLENKLENFVIYGDLDGFKNWTKKAPSIRNASLSSDYLRHEKDTFIISATLLSRAAIKGGMTYNDALNLADLYINKCESQNIYSEIANLSYTMMVDFIQHIQAIKAKKSPLETKVSIYVFNHLSEKIKLDDLASYLYMTKSNLCLKFKKEVGITVDNFILAKKIDEAKNLLLNKNDSLSTIALYLGFSNQAHFTTVFKKYTKITPQKYRNSI